LSEPFSASAAPASSAPPPRQVGGDPAARAPDPVPAAADEVAIAIGPDAHFEGLLTCPRSTRIDGAFKGQVTGLDRVELGAESRVEGRIEARDIVVAGHFEGELHASRSVKLRETARVTGDIDTRELSAEEGCTVTGRCRTRGSASKDR
jgi:cytoskeletal protein CcmA (bactofilin family)